MTYICVKWKHASPDYPVLFYSELDDDRREVRKVEVFGNGRIGFATHDRAVGGTFIGKVRIPTLAEIAADGQFEPSEISAGEFEKVWAKRRRPLWRRRSVIIAGLIFMGLVYFSVFHFCSVPSKPGTPTSDYHGCHSSTSPDGRYICVVAEKNPQNQAGSQHIYSFGIIGVGPHEIASLPGEVLEINNGSIALSIQDPRWDVEGVTIFENAASPKKVAICVVRNGKQYWTDCRVAPSTATSASSLPTASSGF